jgi:RNA polymerase sigma-70 factor (ECF subfamily)
MVMVIEQRAGWDGDDFDAVPESRLIELARSDPAAFAALYRRYLRRVYRYLLIYADREEDTADLTQHVFLRVLEALSGYSDRGVPFAAWLFRIARNAATDAYRRRRKAIPWEHVPEALLPPASWDPLAASIRREALNELRVLVARLDPEKQEMLALRFAAGLTSAEIGSIVGKSEAAVKRQLSRTIASLRRAFRDE